MHGPFRPQPLNSPAVGRLLPRVAPPSSLGGRRSPGGMLFMLMQDDARDYRKATAAALAADTTSLLFSSCPEAIKAMAPFLKHAATSIDAHIFGAAPRHAIAVDMPRRRCAATPVVFLFFLEVAVAHSPCLLPPMPCRARKKSPHRQNIYIGSASYRQAVLKMH